VLLAAYGTAMSIFACVRCTVPEVPSFANFSVSSIGVCVESVRHGGRLLARTSLCFHDEMACDEVAEFVVRGEGEVIGSSDMDADGAVELDDKNVLGWEGDCGKQSNDVLLILSELPDSVWISEEDSFLCAFKCNDPVAMSTDFFGIFEGLDDWPVVTSMSPVACD